MASILGIQSPANFVFLAVIAILLEKMFSLSIQVSLLENKVEVMAAELALRCKNIEDRVNAIDSNDLFGDDKTKLVELEEKIIEDFIE